MQNNITMHKRLNMWHRKIGLKPIDYSEGRVNRDDYITTDLLESYRLPVNKVYLMVQNVAGKFEYRILKVLENHKRFVVFECTPIPKGGFEAKGYKSSYNTSLLKTDLIKPDITKTEDGVLVSLRNQVLCTMPKADELRELCKSA